MVFGLRNINIKNESKSCLGRLRYLSSVIFMFYFWYEIFYTSKGEPPPNILEKSVTHPDRSSW